MGDGAQKLFGLFGGGGPEGTGRFFESLGLRPGRRNAMAAGAAELGGGALVATGTLMPVGAAALSGTMVTAIRHVHLEKGPWATEGGYEYNLTILAALLALTHERNGTFWALAQLLAGTAGSLATSALARSEATPQPHAQQETVGGEPQQAAQEVPLGATA
jgi:putative oxidoreductase